MTFDASMVSGDTKILNITAQTSTGTALNLNGATITWQLFPLGGGTALVTKSIGSGITVTDASNGVFQVKIDPADTASLAGSYNHEVQIVDTDGNVLTPRNVGLSPGVLEIAADLIV